MLAATALIAFFTKLGILADLLSVSTLFIFMLVAVALLVRRYYVTGETSSRDRNKFLVFLGLILASSVATAVYWALEKDDWIGYCVTVPIWFLSTAGMKFLVAQARAPKLWGVPLVPWLPSASIAINIFLLGSIDAKSYIRSIRLFPKPQSPLTTETPRLLALSQSDGRWRYSSNNPESSSFAVGLAFETLGGVISLAPSEIDQSLPHWIDDFFGLLDDGTFYFDGSEGPISTTASVIRGLKSFAASESTGLNLAGDKIVGVAKFFLGVGIPGDAKDFFNQIDAVACLEDNRQCYFHAPSMQFLFGLFQFAVPLILSLSSTVISLTKKEPLKVKVSTVLGSKAPALNVKLTQALSSGSKGSSIINNQELMFDADSATYFLDSFPKNFDVGKYTFVFEILLDELAHEKVYITEAQTKVPIAATGAISIENAEISVLDSDVGSVESQKKLDLTKDGAVSLSANHLQKLRLSYQLTTPLGHVFKPHQAFIKLKHESQVEHVFLVKASGKKSELVIVEFLKLHFEFKLYYLSGKYEIQLTIGDASMENSLLSNIGHIELDLPERPEKAPRPPLQPTDPYSRYGPKAEISHIFRVPEKLPAKQLSLVFLGLIVLPFIAFLIGLTRLGVNIKSFPSLVGAATSALLFHGGIGAVLLLYVLFWLKLDLFTTLKALSLLGVFLLFVGHSTLSHLASASNKLKSA
ncbi:hypothetical protein Bca52824_038179 [Brassica carinata]|uniref:Dolichyl-diphosphooligosaccharide--protein glycosyltransferase subunit 2 n=1 Tax=Brassica carinata TaxID=52824 RepID=A0A8X7UTG5_BRACI|nr:hypothetical protein Bca52824_038179 [Brassica carinata]